VTGSKHSLCLSTLQEQLHRILECSQICTSFPVCITDRKQSR
jgi:hypothetical protein